MIIEGVERGILLFIDDMDGNELDDFFFHDFYEYNDFIKEQGGKYLGCNASYSIVEVIDDKPEPFSWTNYIDLLELEDEEIDEIIEDYIREEAECKKYCEKLNQETEILSKDFVGGNPDEKLKWKGEYSYVCPYCMFDLNNCICNCYPFHLIQIDTNILPVIRVLNMKGYKTTSCCGGHLVDEITKCQCIYISFKEKYDFSVPYPENGIYTSDGSLRYEKGDRKTVEELSIFQEETINSLLKWANELEENL